MVRVTVKASKHEEELEEFHSQTFCTRLSRRDEIDRGKTPQDSVRHSSVPLPCKSTTAFVYFLQ